MAPGSFPAVGTENCWLYGWGSCHEIHQTDFSFDLIGIKAVILRRKTRAEVAAAAGFL